MWLIALAHAQDLVVDGTVAELSGVVAFDRVVVVNGGVLRVTPYDGSPGSGALEILADEVVVDATSAIDARGAGFPGTTNGAGQGPGGGGSGSLAGGGGGHGGSGGSGRGAAGVAANGAVDGASEAGSGGGAPPGSVVAGGTGGGSVRIEAARIRMDGRIDADGLDGPVSTGGAGAGGGAGGGVVLVAQALYCPGVI